MLAGTNCSPSTGNGRSLSTAKFLVGKRRPPMPVRLAHICNSPRGADNWWYVQQAGDCTGLVLALLLSVRRWTVLERDAAKYLRGQTKYQAVAGSPAVPIPK